MLNMVDKMNADSDEEQENCEVICEEYGMNDNLLDEIYTASKTEKKTVKESHLKVTYSDEDMDIDFDKILYNQEMAKRRRLEDSTGHQETNKLGIFKKSFLSACEEVEKFNRLCKLTVQEVIPSYPQIIRDAAMISVERLFYLFYV